MWLRLIVILLFTCIATQAPQAVGSNYDPRWQPGDHWTVRFSVRRMLRPKQAGPPPADVTVNVDYAYTVMAVTGDKVVIEATAEGLPKWLLTFDTDTVVLLTVEEVLNTGERVRHANPFAGGAWMAELEQYHSRIVHDFPRLPDSEVDETRDLQPAQSGTPGFRQRVTFGLNAATVVLSRTDPASSAIHKTTIVWEKGSKWWSSAVVKLGTDVEVSGTLIP